jgi:hypothetical protein
MLTSYAFLERNLRILSSRVNAASAATCRVTALRDPWHVWFLTEIRNPTRAVTLQVMECDIPITE